MMDESREKFADLLIVRENNFSLAVGPFAIRAHEEGGEAKTKKANGEDEDIPARILIARGGTSNDILTNPTYFAGYFSLFRARPPPIHLHPVSPMVRPYFFVPRNYSSQITGRAAVAENL